MEGLEKQSIWEQMKEIVMFTGPATGLWLCGPLMSLIDTAVIGQRSSLELAALGPGTVICDYTSYLFMFLSIATSNLVATSLARQDKKEVQHQISILLFVGLTCGFLMLFYTKFFGPWALTGPKNLDIVPAANTYVQIRALAWPAVLVGWVAQSASLGMKDSWGPLKALTVATVVNGIGDVVLCIFLGYGIAGAAWATMVSQVIAAYMMIEALNKKGYNAFAFSVPSPNEVLTILGLAAPIFVAFWALVTYFATSMGAHVVAAHQVFRKVCLMKQARMLLSSLLIIGATLGLVLGIVGTSVPWLFPNIFTPDQTVIQEMQMVLIPYFIALSVAPSTHSLEGAMLLARNGGYGLPGCWCALVGFQWARFFFSLQRLLSPDGILYSEDLSRLRVLLAIEFLRKILKENAKEMEGSGKPALSLVSPDSHSSLSHPGSLVVKSRSRLLAPCISPAQESGNNSVTENESGTDSVSELKEETEREVTREVLGNQSMWAQMEEIMKFTGPAIGLWICGPLMSLIDTAVIGQGSSIELAALGPGTVLCDGMSYLFMFLSIATSNMIATSLAEQDKNEVQHQLSMLLFVGLTCGSLMLFFTKFFGPSALTDAVPYDIRGQPTVDKFAFVFCSAFTGSNNLDIIPAANTYVQIRGLAWPAILIGWVAQSASLGMKDSWGPLKALAVASAVNGIGDIVLCRFLGYGIAGAAWATMASQIIAAFMMIDSLNKKGYNAYAISVPSPNELMMIFKIAAPVFIVMMSKVAFYSLIVYFVTSMGTLTLAAHQVMIQALFMCTVWGEPLSQTAQSFMPEFMYGINRSLEKARTLLKSLAIIGTILGLVLGIVGTSVPWLFPNIFTHDQKIIQEVNCSNFSVTEYRIYAQSAHTIFLAIAVTPCTLSLEGTLLSVSMLVVKSVHVVVALRLITRNLFEYEGWMGGT
ncbi:unnamed protein product [Dovyalis caffra]|uniref:Protein DETOXIFICATION n=1 Tax=Dovyalis caffra TaxID=77055 RepID=A0AAV1R738_9ROSI|nr:unnamed protein product [Dovyalis caffra]